MRRQIPILRGLAILAVVCNHAAGWGYTAMFWWVHRYRLATPPNFDQIGTLQYFFLSLIKQLTALSVPAFLFIAGFFLSYISHGRERSATGAIIRIRIANLLWPYLIWSLLIFFMEFLQGNTFSFADYLKKLIFGGAEGGYFFIPLLIQFYIFGPTIVSIARTRPFHLLVASALLQLTTITISFYYNLGVLTIGSVINQGWPFALWAFYFPFGVVCGLNLKRVNSWLLKYRTVLFIATLIFIILSMAETEILYHLTGNLTWAQAPARIISSFYSTTAILFLLSLDFKLTPLIRAVDRMGVKSYGIYLLNEKVLEFVSRVIYHLAPLLLSRQILLQLILIPLGVGIPLLLMKSVEKSPVRWLYRHIFA